MDKSINDKIMMELREQLSELFAGAHLLTPVIREEGDPQGNEAMSHINHSLYSLLRMVNHLELCREEAPMLCPTAVDLSSLIREVGRELEWAARELGVSFWWEIDREGAVTMADRALLEQAILNLVSNALQFTPAGGRVLLRSTTDRGLFTVTVQDTGAGFPRPGEPPADPLVKRPGGIGLGLEAARRIATLHGGRLIRQDSQGTGAAVVFSIPIQPPAEGEAVMASQPALDRTGGFSQVLVELAPLLPAKYFRPDDLE